MKPFNELTSQELAKLTNEEIDQYVRWEAAEQGLEFITKPVAPIPVAPELSQDIVAWQVGDVVFKYKEDAERVIQMELLHKAYEWSSGYSLFWLEPHEYCVFQIKSCHKEDLVAWRSALAIDKSAREAYEQRLKQYTDFTEQLQEIIKGLRATIFEAQNYWDTVTQGRAAWDEYLTLADGKLVIAERFFVKAYYSRTEDWYFDVLGAKGKVLWEQKEKIHATYQQNSSGNGSGTQEGCASDLDS